MFGSYITKPQQLSCQLPTCDFSAGIIVSMPLRNQRTVYFRIHGCIQRCPESVNRTVAMCQRAAR